MGAIRLTDQDRADLVKLVATEVDHALARSSPEEYRRQAQGVVDTVLNRMASPEFPDTVREIADQRRQFSKITGPAHLDPYGSITKVPASVVPKGFDSVVNGWLNERARGVPSSVGGNLHYANPNFSDEKNLAWIEALDGPRFGSGERMHYHGTTRGFHPVEAVIASDRIAPTPKDRPAWLSPSAGSRVGYGKQPGTVNRLADAPKPRGGNDAFVARSMAQIGPEGGELEAALRAWVGPKPAQQSSTMRQRRAPDQPNAYDRVRDTLHSRSNTPARAKPSAGQPRAADLTLTNRTSATPHLRTDGSGIVDPALVVFGNEMATNIYPAAGRNVPPMGTGVAQSYAGQERSSAPQIQAPPQTGTRQSYAAQDGAGPQRRLQDRTLSELAAIYANGGPTRPNVTAPAGPNPRPIADSVIARTNASLPRSNLPSLLTAEWGATQTNGMTPLLGASGRGVEIPSLLMNADNFSGGIASLTPNAESLRRPARVAPTPAMQTPQMAATRSGSWETIAEIPTSQQGRSPAQMAELYRHGGPTQSAAQRQTVAQPRGSIDPNKDQARLAPEVFPQGRATGVATLLDVVPPPPPGPVDFTSPGQDQARFTLLPNQQQLEQGTGFRTVMKDVQVENPAYRVWQSSQTGQVDDIPLGAVRNMGSRDSVAQRGAGQNFVATAMPEQWITVKKPVQVPVVAPLVVAPPVAQIPQNPVVPSLLNPPVQPVPFGNGMPVDKPNPLVSLLNLHPTMRIFNALGGQNMGKRIAPVGASLGTAANGGRVTQGHNGLLNSITQRSDYWKQATGQSSGGGGDAHAYSISG
ncbi:MAG TPA: cell wall hydrolase [Pseudorhizobium sp.]|jgi:hypothetical protein|nr:cell wall hydrolase [Pseudorhizobium sp.]